MSGLPSRTGYPSGFAESLGWFGAEPQTAVAAKPPDFATTAIEISIVPSYFYDASLLFRCMAVLNLDRDRLAEDDPLLFHELQGRCALCPDKQACVEALAIGFSDASWDLWRGYCVNATTLMTIGATQNSSRVVHR